MVNYDDIVVHQLFFFSLKNWGIPQIAVAQTTQTTELNQLDVVAKKNMVLALSQKTGLNEEFSKM